MLCIHPRIYQNHIYTPTAIDVHLKAFDTFVFQLTYLSVQNLTVSSIDKQKKKHRLQNLSISACWWPELHFSHAAPSWYWRKDFPFMAIYLHATLHAEGSWLCTLRGFGVDKSVVNRAERGAQKLSKKKLLKEKEHKQFEINSILSYILLELYWLAN